MDKLTLLRHFYAALNLVGDLAGEVHNDEVLDLVVSYQNDVEGLIRFHEAMNASDNVLTALSFRDAA